VWPINARSRSRLLVSIVTIALLITACGGNLTPTATPEPPTFTLTPQSTPLPTFGGTVQSFGSDALPFQIILVPPKDSTETGAVLAQWLSDQTHRTFTIKLAASNAEILNAMCSETPTIAWADGWTMLAVLAQDCGTVAARTTINGATGVRADIVVSPSAAINDVRNFRNRSFCRINAQDTISWVLPVVAMRAGGFNPAELRSVQDYPDSKSMLQIVANNGCVSAIPAGTLSSIKLDPPFSDATRVVSRLSTTPELPYGGLVISSAIPPDLGAQVTDLFLSNPDQLKGLVTADSFAAANGSDFKDLTDTLQAGGISLKALAGQ